MKCLDWRKFPGARRRGELFERDLRWLATRSAKKRKMISGGCVSRKICEGRGLAKICFAKSSYGLANVGGSRDWSRESQEWVRKNPGGDGIFEDQLRTRKLNFFGAKCSRGTLRARYSKCNNLKSLKSYPVHELFCRFNFRGFKITRDYQTSVDIYERKSIGRAVVNRAGNRARKKTTNFLLIKVR